jgi:hypothetical protein
MEAEGLNIKWSRGQRYVGGFVGSEKMRERWITPKVEEWVAGIGKLAEVGRRYPQSAYVGLVHCLQAEWQYVCRVEPEMGPYLAPVENALRNVFIPALLDLKRGDTINDGFRLLLARGIKSGGLAIRNPVEVAARLHTASVDSAELLVESLLSNGDLDCAAHLARVREAGAAMRKERAEKDEEVVKNLAELGGAKVKKRLERMLWNGSWLSAIPDRMSGTVLTREEWLDNVYLRYGLQLRDLPRKCDGCGKSFSVEHGLSCKTGGLVGARHNDARDEWAHLCSLALGGSSVGTEPFIFYGAGVRAAEGRDATTNGSTSTEARNNSAGDEARGDVRARGFWKPREDCIFDIVITDTDAKCYGDTSSKKLVERLAKRKVDKYEAACKERRRSFTALAYSVCGLPCESARSAEKRLGGLLAKKWERNYSEMVSFIRQRMSLAIVRSNTLLLRGDRAGTWRRRGAEDGVAAGATPSMRTD